MTATVFGPAHAVMATRLELLYEQWNGFIESGAAVMRWCIRRDEARVIDGFVQLEAHEEGGRLPAFFVHVVEPCLAPGYGEVVLAELRALVDAWRMAGYCHERCGDEMAAFAAYAKAIRAGASIVPDQRPNSTLAYAGAAAIDVARRHWNLRDKADAIEIEMVQLLGVRDWRPQ